MSPRTIPAVKITVAYAGQTLAPQSFLMILDWIRTLEGLAHGD
jgi:hypothetical protein